jgi:hypothetical protein
MEPYSTNKKGAAYTINSPKLEWILDFRGICCSIECWDADHIFSKVTGHKVGTKLSREYNVNWCKPMGSSAPRV